MSSLVFNSYKTFFYFLIVIICAVLTYVGIYLLRNHWMKHKEKLYLDLLEKSSVSRNEIQGLSPKSIDFSPNELL